MAGKRAGEEEVKDRGDELNVGANAAAARCGLVHAHAPAAERNGSDTTRRPTRERVRADATRQAIAPIEKLAFGIELRDVAEFLLPGGYEIASIGDGLISARCA
jgi:hypothetical protein